jgi:hypothetical protein
MKNGQLPGIGHGEAFADLLEGDDTLSVGSVDADVVAVDFDVGDADAGGAVKAAGSQSIHDARHRALARHGHVPTEFDVAGGVAVVVGEAPEAAPGGEQKVPFVQGVGAAVQSPDHAVENLQAQVAGPLLHQGQGAMVEASFPVGVVDDDESAVGQGVVDSLLAIG